MVDENEVFSVDVNSKLADLEEKYNLLRERVITLGDTVINSRDSLNKEIIIIKDDIKDIKAQIETLNESIQHIITELSNFSRKEEIEIFQRYMKMFEPIKFVREEDVGKIVREEIKKQNVEK